MYGLGMPTYLERLQCVVELWLAHSSRGGHGHRRRDGGDAPTELVLGSNAELVAVRRAKAVHHEVLVTDVISQVHPVNVSVCSRENYTVEHIYLVGLFLADACYLINCPLS